MTPEGPANPSKRKFLRILGLFLVGAGAYWWGSKPEKSKTAENKEKLEETSEMYKSFFTEQMATSKGDHIFEFLETCFPVAEQVYRNYNKTQPIYDNGVVNNSPPFSSATQMLIYALIMDTFNREFDIVDNETGAVSHSTSAFRHPYNDFALPKTYIEAYIAKHPDNMMLSELGSRVDWWARMEDIQRDNSAEAKQYCDAFVNNENRTLVNILIDEFGIEYNNNGMFFKSKYQPHYAAYKRRKFAKLNNQMKSEHTTVVTEPKRRISKIDIKKRKPNSNETLNGFIEQMVPYALNEQIVFGIPASITIAQAILESNWGGSVLSGKAKNLFGLKCPTCYNGKTCTRVPPCVYRKDDENEIHKDKFKSYNHFSGSVRDHSLLFYSKNERYKKLFYFNDLFQVLTDYDTKMKYLDKYGFAKKNKITGKYILSDEMTKNDDDKKGKGNGKTKLMYIASIIGDIYKTDGTGRTVIDDNDLANRKAYFQQHPQELWACGISLFGYATEPDYAPQLINLINKHDLTAYDLR